MRDDRPGTGTAVHLFIRAKPGKRHTLLTHIADLFDTMRAEPTFVSAAVHPVLDAEDELHVYEIWSEPRAALEMRLKVHPAFARYQKVAADLVVMMRPTFLAHPPLWPAPDG
ncbi:MAG: antibiotic biosynthesis monooxygenase [Pseudomonadota bacterium]